jgi:hypothetical protein
VEVLTEEHFCSFPLFLTALAPLAWGVLPL